MSEPTYQEKMAEGFASLPSEQRELIQHILGYAQKRDMPWDDFAPRLRGVLTFFNRMLQEIREEREKSPAAEVPRGASAYDGPEPHEDAIEDLVANLPEATRGLFLRCASFQEENRYSAADMAAALADVQAAFTAVHGATRTPRFDPTFPDNENSRN